MAIDKKLLAKLNATKFVAFDFDGVLTDNRVFVFEDGKEAVVCSRGDGWGIKMMREYGIPMAIISTEVNPVVTARAKKLKIPCTQSCEDKVQALESFLSALNLSLEDAAFVGNDLNDLPLLNRVGLAVAVGDAVDEVKQAADIVLSKNGGFGAVREFCDLFLKSKKLNSKEREIA